MPKPLQPLDTVETIITEAKLQEAVTTVEEQLALEDTGWVNLSAGLLQESVTDQQRILNIRKSRQFYAKDPLGRQSIRLWTDYTFGTGFTWDTEDEGAKKALKAFWDSKENQSCLSARGQRTSSDKLLVDGEVFFVLFVGPKETTIRRIDPLEITEIVTDPDDIETVMFYRREWTNRLGNTKTAIYRSFTNIANKPCQSATHGEVTKTEDGIVYHLAYNTIGQRGNPLLLPALDWLKQYRRFLASRVAVMLALAKFAWKGKVAGGQTQVDAVKAVTHDKAPQAGSTLYENMGVDTTPIKTDSGAKQAYQDGRMIRLQVCAAVGIPEQYFGDISTGNLATAKTVELPMLKMFESYQQVWNDTYQAIDELVLEQAKISSEKWYVDRDFPDIAPADIEQASQSLVDVVGVMPDFAYSNDVRLSAMSILGINDPAEALEELEKLSKSTPAVQAASALKQIANQLNPPERSRGNGKNGEGQEEEASRAAS